MFQQFVFGGKFFAVYIQVTHCKENKAEAVQLLSSAKLTLKQLITKAKVSELEFHMTKKVFSQAMSNHPVL